MKVLIISHNPMSMQHSIGKTLLSFFSEFNREELCQLYIHTGVPEQDICSSFYRVTDKDVLKGVLNRRVHGGTVHPKSEYKEENKKGEGEGIYDKFYSSAKKRNPDREILRDLMWQMSPWYNSDVKKWIVEQNPTCVFAAIGSSKFLYEIAIRISKDYNLPLVTYVCDDFYFMKPQKNILGFVWRKLLRKKTKELMAQTSTIVSICEEMTMHYGNEFVKPALTIMTGSNYDIAKDVTVKEEVRILRYFGKLSLNRYKSMVEVCQEIDTFNTKNGKEISVEIYCGNVDDNIKKEFENIQCAKFFNFISGEEFRTKFLSSDALIHVEAFDEESIDRVKYSVSTKIADTLSSGIPLIAYAPENVASMKHLLRNHCAITAVTREELFQKITLLLTDTATRKYISRNAISTAQKYHNPKEVSLRLHHILESQVSNQ